MPVIRTAIATLLSLLSLPARAQSPTPASTGASIRDVSSLLDPILAEHKIPGMAVAIVNGWDTVATGAAGVRKSGDKEPVTPSDKWHLGSDTKAMTATLCGILVDQGNLRWEMTLAEAFPDLAADATQMDPAWKPVTLEQLLTNRAGAPADLNKDSLWSKLRSFKGAPKDARRALLEGVLKHPPVHTPGTKFLYSNAGFAIAGHIAESTMNTPWEALMVEKLFDPLKISSVGFGAPGEKDKLDQPRGHRPDGPAVEPGPAADNPVAIGPAGIVHCSIGDWAKFIALHLRGDPRNPNPESKLVRAETMKKLHEAGPGEGARYAMGWIVTSRGWGGNGILTHAGSNTMWYCTTWVAPEKDLAVLIVCNQGGDAAVKACDQAASTLIREAAR